MSTALHILAWWLAISFVAAPFVGKYLKWRGRA